MLVQAQLLARQGYDTWSWGDRALLRAVTFLSDLSRRDPRWWSEAMRDDAWEVDVVNYWYGTAFPAAAPARPGKNIAWTSWTHARG